MFFSANTKQGTKFRDAVEIHRPGDRVREEEKKKEPRKASIAEIAVMFGATVHMAPGGKKTKAKRKTTAKRRPQAKSKTTPVKTTATSPAKRTTKRRSKP